MAHQPTRNYQKFSGFLLEMKVNSIISDIRNNSLRDSTYYHIAIGMFDGLHLGHQRVINSCLHAREKHGGVAAVLSFNPHPRKFFPHQTLPKRIMPIECQALHLLKMGIDRVIQQKFDQKIAEIESNDFLQFLKQYIPGLQTIHIGSNFCFGKGRLGNACSLQKQASKNQIEETVKEPYYHQGSLVSSTRIREHLSKGQMETANDLLGYPYYAIGIPEPGKGIGKKIGFPTLNIGWEPENRPPLGVYKVQVNYLEKGHLKKPLLAIANYGLRPTLENSSQPKLEVHFQKKPTLESHRILKIQWLRFIRPERKFSSIDDLSEQIKKDIENVFPNWQPK